MHVAVRVAGVLTSIVAVAALVLLSRRQPVAATDGECPQQGVGIPSAAVEAKCRAALGAYYGVLRQDHGSGAPLTTDLVALVDHVCATQGAVQQAPWRCNATTEELWTAPLEPADAAYVRSLAEHPERVLVLIVHFNRPDLISAQLCTLQRHFADEFDYVVINDGADTISHAGIRAECERLGVRCISTPMVRPPRAGTVASVEVARTLTWALDRVGHPSRRLVFSFHADILLLKPFSLRAFLGGHHLAGVCMRIFDERRRVEVRHLIDAMFAYDAGALPDVSSFRMGCCYYRDLFGDTGIHSAAYLEAHPNLTVVEFGGAFVDRKRAEAETTPLVREILLAEVERFAAAGQTPYMGLFMVRDVANVFVHIRSVSGWSDVMPAGVLASRLGDIRASLIKYLGCPVL